MDILKFFKKRLHVEVLAEERTATYCNGQTEGASTGRGGAGYGNLLTGSGNPYSTRLKIPHRTHISTISTVPGNPYGFSMWGHRVFAHRFFKGTMWAE